MARCSFNPADCLPASVDAAVGTAPWRRDEMALDPNQELYMTSQLKCAKRLLQLLLEVRSCIEIETDAFSSHEEMGG